MIGFGPTLAAIALGSALVARPALAQGGSTSLTHTVSVTVPPRVKVQVGNLVSAMKSAASVPVPSNGLAVSVRASQSWTLSIGSANGDPKLQWSKDASSGFSVVSRNGSPIASGDISPTPAAANVFVRSGGKSGDEGSDIVILTVVAP